MLVSFVIIGAPKCGTTTLWHLMSQIGLVRLSSKKELRYFSHEENYMRGASWYYDQYDLNIQENIIGDISPQYTCSLYSNEVCERIYHHNPNTNIVYMVRNPFDRIVSQWKQFLSTGHPISGNFNHDLITYPTIVDDTRYWHNVEKYIELFGDDKVWIGFLEDLKTNPKAFMRDLMMYLTGSYSGIDEINYEIQNAGTRKRVWNLLGRNMLRNRIYSGTRRRLSLQDSLFEDLLLKNRIREPVWNSKAREIVRNRLIPDVKSILSYCNKPNDYWGEEFCV